VNASWGRVLLAQMETILTAHKRSLLDGVVALAESNYLFHDGEWWVRSSAVRAALGGDRDDEDAESLCKCGHKAWIDHGGIMAPPSGCDECFCTLNEEQAAAGQNPTYSNHRGGES
jgi:hypothetical protein